MTRLILAHGTINSTLNFPEAAGKMHLSEIRRQRHKFSTTAILVLKRRFLWSLKTFDGSIKLR